MIKAAQQLQIGKWDIEPESRRIRQHGSLEILHLRPKLMEILSMLVKANGGLVTRNEILSKVWPETIARDESLTRAIADLRRQLDGDNADRSLITTIPKSGYCIELSPAIETAKLSQNRYNSIVVLPFDNHANDERLEYLSEGISEEIISILKRASGIHVVPRSSAFSFKDKTFDLQKIATDLKVDLILHGHLSNSLSTVRMEAKLTDSQSLNQLWSGSFEVKEQSLLPLIKKVAFSTLRELRLSLPAVLPLSGSNDPRAYSLMLKGRHLANLNTQDGWIFSNKSYEQALEIDPNYAEVWAGLAKNYALAACDGLCTFSEGFTQARAAVNRAIEIHPENPMALSMLGWLQMYDSFDLRAAAKSFETALKYSPGNTDILLETANLAKAIGTPDLAVKICKFVVSGDPVNARAYRYLGICHRINGEPGEAIKAFEKALKLSPHISSGHAILGFALIENGNPKKALDVIENETSDLWRQVGLAMVQHVNGNQNESDAALEILIKQYPTKTAYNIAYVEAFRGNKDSAFEWLNKAIEYRDPGIAHFTTEKFFDFIHDDSRWLDLLRRTNQSQEKLAKIKLRVLLDQQERNHQ